MRTQWFLALALMFPLLAWHKLLRPDITTGRWEGFERWLVELLGPHGVTIGLVVAGLVFGGLYVFERRRTGRRE